MRRSGSTKDASARFERRSGATWPALGQVRSRIDVSPHRSLRAGASMALIPRANAPGHLPSPRKTVLARTWTPESTVTCAQMSNAAMSNFETVFESKRVFIANLILGVF